MLRDNETPPEGVELVTCNVCGRKVPGAALVKHIVREHTLGANVRDVFALFEALPPITPTDTGQRFPDATITTGPDACEQCGAVRELAHLVLVRGTGPTLREERRACAECVADFASAATAQDYRPPLLRAFVRAMRAGRESLLEIRMRARSAQ